MKEVSTLQETELQGNAKTLKTTLENADGEIATLNNRIEENRKEIRNLQAQVRTIPCRHVSKDEHLFAVQDCHDQREHSCRVYMEPWGDQ